TADPLAAETSGGGASGGSDGGGNGSSEGAASPGARGSGGGNVMAGIGTGSGPGGGNGGTGFAGSLSGLMGGGGGALNDAGGDGHGGRRAGSGGVRGAGGVGDAVGGITRTIDAKLEKGDLLVVWLMDESISLLDDRQMVAEKIGPYFRSIEARDKKGNFQLYNAVVGFGYRSVELVKPTRFSSQILEAIRN